jgi:hypothetical protein
MAMGTATAWTIVGALVGYGIAGFAWVIQLMFGLFVWGIIYAFFMMRGIKPSSKRLMMLGISFIIEKLPGLSFLPMTSISFFGTVRVENLKRKGGLAGKIAQQFT